jgi:hypothetical protein
LVNGEKVDWRLNDLSIGKPSVLIETIAGDKFEVEIEWTGSPIEVPEIKDIYATGDKLNLRFPDSSILEIYDPQNILGIELKEKRQLSAQLTDKLGWKTVFVKLKQNDLEWWQPFSFELRPPIEVIYDKGQPIEQLTFKIRNNSEKDFNGTWSFGSKEGNINISACSSSEMITISEGLIPGSNEVIVKKDKQLFQQNIQNWNVAPTTETEYDRVNISTFFNDRVSNIFTEQYY